MMDSMIAKDLHCAVCGCESIESDEVAHRGRMWLRECTRCRHRWTERSQEQRPTPARPVRAVKRHSEAARAA